MGQRVNGYCLNFNIKKVKIPLDNSMKTNFRKKGFRLITYDHRHLIVNLEPVTGGRGVTKSSNLRKVVRNHP